MKYFFPLLFIFQFAFSSYSQDWQMHNIFDDYDPGHYGHYETLNEFSQKNCPGLKDEYINWTTSESVYVLESIDRLYALEGFKIMLWEYNIELEQWRCIQDKLDSDYNIGVKGVPDEDNFPGYRSSSPTWVDHDNNLWLFSGQGYYDPDNYIDLWKFDTQTKLWTFVNGAPIANGYAGNYEEIGVPSSTALPSGRSTGSNSHPISFVDRNGDLVLYRGNGSNDLWKYNIESNQWVWLIGEDPADNITYYPYPSPSRFAYERGVFWTDKDNNYFFLDELRTRLTWKVWKFDTQNLEWSTVYEDNQANLNITSFREENAETIITRTDSPLTWNQNNEYMWFFGGDGINMMYRLNLTTYQWAWFNGASPIDIEEEEDYNKILISQGYAYKKGEEREANLPPGRLKGLKWTKNNKFYLGYGSGGYDVWSYNPSTYNFTLEKGGIPSIGGTGVHGIQHNRVDTTIYSPRPYQDSYRVGAIKHGDYIYQFDESRDLFRLNMTTGINEPLRENQTESAGIIGVASEEVYPSRAQILGIFENEIYFHTSIFSKRIYKYNIETNLFTCIKEVDQTQIGSLGEFNDENFPNISYSYFTSWADDIGNIYISFGASIWQYRINVNQWACISFVPSNNLAPMYYSSSNTFSSWVDDEGDLWVFNYSMWRYDTSENTWELIKHGMPEVNTSYYGTQRSFSIFNNPSARMKFINWTDDKGRFWMAHGRAINEDTNFFGIAKRVFNDIWMFDPKIRNWVWTGGSEGPIERSDTIFHHYKDVPYMNVTPYSTDNDYFYHNTYAYNEGNKVTVIENCDGTIWSLDYSSLIPDYNVLSGSAYYDLENNGCDSLDQPFVNLQVILDDFSAFTFTDSDGQYAQFCNETMCNFKADYNVPEAEYFNINPKDTLIDFGSYGQIENVDYCISPTGIFNDIETIMIPLDDPTFGFNSDYEIIFKNKGTTTLSGILKMYYSKLEVGLESYSPDTLGYSNYFTTLDTIQWEFSNLEPFETRKVNMSCRIHPAMQGDTISYKVEACIVDGLEDYMPEDNVFTLEEIVVSSFDPNDKMIIEGDVLPVEKIGDYIHYRIRFENTGTAPARFIYLEDFIDTEIFDVSTLMPVSSSHEYISRVEDQNKLFVMFEDIYLPFDPEEGNKGYFLFKIRINNNVHPNDVLRNTAKIYFDYNDPIITEESVTTFEMLDSDGDGFIDTEDCDDTNSQVNPGQIEVPYNGIDDDCNVQTLDDDLDEDGFNLAVDCDDTNSSINPDAEEILNNGIDEDCDGMDMVSSTYELANTTLTIYPNPAVDIINVDVIGNLTFSCTIYSSEGKLIRRFIGSKLLNIESISSGIYLLEIEDKITGQKLVEKIIIEK